MPMGVPCLIICVIAARRARRYLITEVDTVCSSRLDVRLSTCHKLATAFRRRYGCSPGELRDVSLTASRHCA